MLWRLPNKEIKSHIGKTKNDNVPGFDLPCVAGLNATQFCRFVMQS